MAMSSSENPLLTALPPATDYISYLTIVEQYLTEENLPVLFQVLQDESLTTNIGWDLVHLLLPLLPTSEECLQTIARLGNPREVILKVTESLRLIEFERSDASELPLAVEQFTTLLSLLVTLHARIKTKYPSRFLSTSLQAILASFSAAPSHHEPMILSVVQTIKSMRGIRRPTLPSRSSSSFLNLRRTSSSQASAKDPEAAEVDVSQDESALQQKLYQSFTTFVVEEYLTNMAEEPLAHMAWTTRVMEHLHPERVIPHSKTMSSRFADDPALSERVDTIGQLASISQDLALSDDDLLAAVTVSPEDTQTDGEEEPPAIAADVPLSSTGSALLYATRHVSSTLYGSGRQSTFQIFPDHQSMVEAVLPSVASGMIVEPETVIDACLVLGVLAIENNHIGEPSDADFNRYLHHMSMIASNCSDPSLRGHAHYLVSTVLRSHPEQAVRYEFIRKMLDSSPNLKPIAVGWLKGEIVESVMLGSNRSAGPQLDSFAPLVFPNLAYLTERPLDIAWSAYQLDLSFYLASLNLLFLLNHSDQLRTTLRIDEFMTRHSLEQIFLLPLTEAKQRFSKAIEGNKDGITDGLEREDVEALKAELIVLDQALARAKDAQA